MIEEQKTLQVNDSQARDSQQDVRLLTHVDNDDVDDVEQQAASSERLQKTSTLTLWRFFPPVCYFLLGLTCSSLFHIVFSPARHTAAQESCSDASTARLATQVLKTPVPELPFEVVYFQPNETFQSRMSFDSGVAWNSVLPPGRGFVFVEDPEQYNLLPGEQTEHGPIYSTSMFHQLHCLVQIRNSWEKMATAFEEDDTRHGLYLIEATGHHVHHCLDYIRQGVQCAGDMALEWPRQEGKLEGFAVDGWGVPHACRSWSGIMEYMDAKHNNMSINGDASG